MAYWYEGICPITGALLRLPRTPEVEVIAHSLMAELAEDERYSCEGKMYGVLLVETPTGERQILRAFSGLLQGEAVVSGWVPPIPGREAVAQVEAETLQILARLNQDIRELQALSIHQQLAQVQADFDQRLTTLKQHHQRRKQARARDRQGLCDAQTLQTLERQSQRDSTERRRLNQERAAAIAPLQAEVQAITERIAQLKRDRKTHSQRLQAQMHANYRLLNFLGMSSSLQALMPKGLPTGTGDCCAPKLLHTAASQGWRAIALAEFWWGPSLGDKIQGQFYGACTERCQPMMGFMLAGLPPSSKSWTFQKSPTFQDLPILYEDDWLVAIAKPAGLLSVPGRSSDRQDSALLRLRDHYPSLYAIHRLDQDTSGILLFAKDLDSYRALTQQFHQRQVQKHYEAIVVGTPAQSSGTIDLPLWGDPRDRPRQCIDPQRGKPSQTQFKILGPLANSPSTQPLTRIEFQPLTGRTHQIRVHAAQGLGTPIWGDRLYTAADSDSKNNLLLSPRLYLHARELSIWYGNRRLHLITPTPF